MKCRLYAIITLTWACAGIVHSAVAATEHFIVLSGGERTGRLDVETHQDITLINYGFVNNGRGPKFIEHLAVDSNGIPTEWRIDGNTMFGAAVHEHFKWYSGNATWESQADSGSVQSSKPMLYITDDGSPWDLGIYVRALLRQPRGTLDVLPTGRLRLEKLRDVTIGEKSQARQVTAYAVSGLDLTPKLVFLDNSGALFAQIGKDPGTPAFIVIREGYESHARELQDLSQAVEMESAQKLQRDLAHRFDEPIRINHVRIFNPKKGTLGPLASVIVYRGTITAVTPDEQRASDGEVGIDGEGGTIVPGLHDMHSHTTVQTGLLYLAAGVTTTRDMGNDNSFLLDLVRRIDSGELAGPRIVRNGLLEGRSPYSVRLGMIPDTLDEALKDVRWYGARGYFQIKIYNSMIPDWVKPIAEEAHRVGMRVTGHVPAFMTADRVIQDGYDEITHLNLLLLSWILDTTTEDTRTALRVTALGRAADLDLSGTKVRTTVELMKARNIPLDPTAVIIERLMLARAGTVQEADKPYLDHTPIGYQRLRKRSFVKFKDEAEDLAFRKGFEKGLAVLRLLDDNGIQLLPGTDDASGFTIHRELELYVKAGLPAPKVLRMATLDCERYLGRDQELGSIERGKLADFILVAGDPTQDISQIRQVRMTVKGGVVYFPAQIYEALGIRPFATSPPIHYDR